MKLRLKKLPLSGWHYQNKSYPVVEIGCDSSIIISFFKILFQFYFERLFKLFFKKVHYNVPYLFTVWSFLWQQQHLFSTPPPPPPPHPPLLSLQTEIVIQFYPWSKCYFLLSSTYYHTLPYPKTYLPRQYGKLPVKESRDANLSSRFWRLSVFLFPLPHLSTAPLPPTTPALPHPAPKLTQPPKGIVWSLIWGTCYQNSLSFFPRN